MWCVTAFVEVYFDLCHMLLVWVALYMCNCKGQLLYVMYNKY